MTAYSKNNSQKKSPFTAAEMAELFKEAVNSVATVAVESGATSRKGRQLKTRQPNLPAHCALREVQKNNWQTLFLLKKEKPGR
jgi:hypothetical protein